MRPMKHILASGIVVLTTLIAQQPVDAAEGRVSELHAAPLDASRVSTYAEARGAMPPAR